jgi:catechol 2,3-dioxygenase-like lactoylglutathione lyase family enzyme
MTLKLGHIELFVREPQRSRDFYRDVLGFEVIDEQGRDFIGLSSGGFQILLRPTGASSSPVTYSDSSMAFVIYTDDLLETLELLKSRGLTPSGHDGSPKCPTFTDPGGHWFQVVSPKDQLRPVDHRIVRGGSGSTIRGSGGGVAATPKPSGAGWAFGTCLSNICRSDSTSAGPAQARLGIM